MKLWKIRFLQLKNYQIICGCSISEIRKLIALKQLQCFRIGNRINFRKSTIDNWILLQENNSIGAEQPNSKHIIAFKEGVKNEKIE